MKIILSIGIIILGALAIAGFKFSRFGVETPQYKLVEKDGAFEIRDYPAMVLVSTGMANANPNEGTSFMRLFRYISGDNANEQKISMTTPVLTSQDDGGRQMSFVVPQEIAEKGAPYANSTQVRLDTLAAGRFAAYRFSGAWDVEKFETAKAELMAWLEQQKLFAQYEPMIANYDPPYTPSFLKRNEILVRIEEGTENGLPYANKK